MPCNNSRDYSSVFYVGERNCMQEMPAFMTLSRRVLIVFMFIQIKVTTEFKNFTFKKTK